MLRSLRLPALLIAALAVAGCGSSADTTGGTGGAAPAPKSAGPLTVAPVDGHVGDATTASDTAALEQLPVNKRRTSPDVLKQGVGAGASCPDIDLMPTADNVAAISAATFCLVNGERADAGLPPLAGNDKLAQSSMVHTADMIQGQYFAHEGKDGSDVVDRVRVTGYLPTDREWTVGENLAWGTGTLSTPRGIVKAWMESQGHRENILRPTFREGGMGVAVGNPRATDGQGATYTMNFGAVGGADEATTAAARVTSGTKTLTAAAKRAIAKKRALAKKHALAKKRRARRARAAKARRARAARAAAAAATRR